MRDWIRIDDFLEQHRHPETGRRTIGRDALYGAIRAGRCPHVTLGRRILVPSDALDIMARGTGVGAASVGAQPFPADAA